MKRYQISEDIVDKVVTWIHTRHGVQIWDNVNLSSAGRDWMAPVMDENGVMLGKPHWSAGTQLHVFTKLEELEVLKKREVYRFHVGVERGEGFSYVVTDGGGRKLKEFEQKYALMRCTGCKWVGHYKELKPKKEVSLTSLVCPKCKKGENIEKEGKAWHEFDYTEYKNAVIFVEDGTIPLEEFINAKETESA